MKISKVISLFFVALILACHVVQAEELDVTASAAVLLDAGSGEVLWQRNIDHERAMASTTKIMTAIIALEQGNLDHVTTISKKAASTEGSSMELWTGQNITLRQLLMGLLLCSGNDAAVAIAENIAGSEEAFVVMMNNRARQLGAYHTHFRNPHGLDEPGHYSTAYDLALLARHAMHNPFFAQLVGSKELVVPWHDGTITLTNTNQLLWQSSQIDGIKTGTTSQAGNCLVSSARQNNRRLIAVVLDSDDRWRDSLALLKWGFGY